ncbi:hypothetical protein M1P97_07920 [Parabacteroides sp. GYB001]|nr:hypothetical protein [Parabacteroides leei]
MKKKNETLEIKAYNGLVLLEVDNLSGDTTADALLVRLAENCLRAGMPEEDVVKWANGFLLPRLCNVSASVAT